MHFPTKSLQLLVLLATVAEAWQVTAFDVVTSCSTTLHPRRRVITGAPTLTNCFMFDDDMPGSACTEYWSGSTHGCITGSLLPSAVSFWGTECAAFTHWGCNGAAIAVVSGGATCIGLPIRSFRCTG
ncbi:hypothetical protein QBC44DRAFT_304101 [Cladorrhinum sp. PSN332]|nr:hypothetical protein QBC44DRAFT_304101 [Cladorrhinum sp. PSN332]